MINATVIADSISPTGHRLTTLEVRMPRQILAELLTHRAFSRNSASSRAIPVRRMLEQVRTDPFIPLVWETAKPGMQGGEPLTGAAAARALDAWLDARDFAVRQAERLLDLGLHKTQPNRLVEPFAWHTVIVSGTDWSGFWQQRRSPLAEAHMRATAEAMRAAYDASTPAAMQWTGWHLPYVTPGELVDLGPSVARRVSAARCARVSYLNHGGRRDPANDLALYERLVAADPPHWSPLEHVARPTGWTAPGNFTHWEQLRHIEAAR